MLDRILERSAVELERFVNGFVDSVPDRRGIAEAPVPWSRTAWRFSRSEIPQLIREVRTVLLAQAYHSCRAPAWADPLPVGDEIAPLLHSTSGPMHLLGLFSCSLMMMSYDYPAHPSFTTFGCGVMAHPRAPDHVRDDPELRCEFPARELPGLGGMMIWFGERLPAKVRVELLSR